MKLKNILTILLVLTTSIVCFGFTDKNSKDKTAPKKIETVDFSHIKITDSFWSPRLKNHVTFTLPVCIDQIEKIGRASCRERV